MPRPIRYGSVCSGIEAASVAWRPLGWRPAFLSEIDPFARAVLAHRFPGVPLRGDFTEIKAGDHDAIDLFVGGTPCQSFSVAGLRGGLDDERGNLALEYLRLADRLRPRWLVWENVPGVLSSSGGRDFGAILGGLAELGYGFAWRVLDAQYVRVDGYPRAVPQRRRRVFVVGYLGDWRPPAAVLFERAGLCGHPPPRRTAGQGTATGTARGFGGGRQSGPSDVAAALTAHGQRLDWEVETFVAFTLRGRDGGAMPEADDTGACPSLRAADGGSTRPMVAQAHVIRRLTPRECERLQGFPDDWTAVPHRGKPAADGPRYKALGNSMAVNVMRWIGLRIAQVDAILAEGA